MNELIAMYLAAGTVARFYTLILTKDSYEKKSGNKVHNFCMNYFKHYNFIRFISDGINVVTWPISLGISILGAKIIENMSEEEFYEKFPQFEKYKRK